MKIITILSLCLTTSLSFVHSQILDKTNDDAFTYDDSGLCADIPNCYPSMKNLPEIDDNSQLPPMPLRVGESVSACGASFGSNFSFVVLGADGRQIINSNKRADEYEAIYNKYSALGFSSEADANAYFNIHILNNTPNNQLGYLHWITYKFNDSIKSYMINFGATITEHLAPPLFPLYKALNDTTDNTFSYKYLWLCNDAMNCQFIKRTDICDTSSHVFSSYDIHTAFSDKCNPYMSYRYIPLELPGFSSETDAKINIQLFDSPAVLKNKQNHPTKIQHDF